MRTLDLQLQTLESLLDWRVTLDIVLLAMGIFLLYRTLRITGTWQIVMGIAIAAFIFLLARLLNLAGIEWIYANLSPVLLLGLIIIFQPEIRRFLERAASIRTRITLRRIVCALH